MHTNNANNANNAGSPRFPPSLPPSILRYLPTFRFRSTPSACIWAKTTSISACQRIPASSAVFDLRARTCGEGKGTHTAFRGKENTRLGLIRVKLALIRGRLVDEHVALLVANGVIEHNDEAGEEGEPSGGQRRCVRREEDGGVDRNLWATSSMPRHQCHVIVPRYQRRLVQWGDDVVLWAISIYGYGRALGLGLQWRWGWGYSTIAR